MEKKNYRATKLLAFLFVIMSSFYLVELKLDFLNLGLNASPVYYWAVVGSMLYLFFKIKNKNWEKINYIAFLMLFYIYISQIFLSPDISVLITFSLTYLYFIIVNDLLKYINYKLLMFFSEFFVDFVILLTFIDAIHRFYGLNFDFSIFKTIFSGLEFYKFKINSLMFGGANGVAFLLSSLFVFLFYLGKITHKKYFFRKLIALILIVLTFSRTIYLALIILLFLYILIKALKIKYMKELILFFLFVISLSPHLFLKLISGYISFITDGSFQTKLYISESGWEYILKNNGLWDNLIGFGLGNGVKYLGSWVHNLLLTYILETGLIGFIIFIIFLSYFYKKTAKDYVFFYYLLLISGISFVPIQIPYFFVFMLLLKFLETGKAKIGSLSKGEGRKNEI